MASVTSSEWMRRLSGVTLLTTGLIAAGCGTPDAFPRHEAEAPRHRPADGLLQRPALQLLVQAGLDRDSETLLRSLQDPDALVRARAAFELGSVQDSAAVEGLDDALGDPDPRVRADAAFALGQTPGGAGRALTDALDREGDPDVRRALVEALGKRGDEAGLTALLALSDDDLLPDATLALSRGVIRGVTPPGVVDALVMRMAHPDPAVRQAATYFMARSRDPGVWYPHRLDIRRTLASYDRSDPAAMYILQGFGRAMSLFNLPTVIDWLRTSPDWRIRANAAGALAGSGELPGPGATALVRALDDLSAHVRKVAATGLTNAPPMPGTLQGILTWVRTHPDDHATTLPLLSILAQTGREELVLDRVRMIPEHEETEWIQAIQALGYLPGATVIDELGDIAVSRPPRVQAAAARSLAERWAIARDVPATHATFREVMARVARRGSPRAAVAAAEVLADPALAGEGTAADLTALWRRMRPGQARDSLARILAVSADPALRALVADAVPDTARDGRDAGGQGSGGRAFLPLDWERLRTLGAHPRLILVTERGTISLTLSTEEAPETVLGVAKLADEGRYDGVPFHRVVANFVIQGGDVSTGNGTGGPDFTLRSELTRIPFLRGVVGMASAGKDTEGSQYFITHSMQPHLDGGYTAFGWVTRGMDVVDRIMPGDRVLQARILPGP